MDNTTQSPVYDDHDLPCLTYNCGFWKSCKEHPKLTTFNDVYTEYLLDSYSERKLSQLGAGMLFTFCEICCKKFDKKNDLKDHLKEHHFNNNQVNISEVDIETTDWKINQIIYRVIHHLTTHCLNFITDTKSRDSIDGASKRPCEICGKLVTDCFLRNHLLKHVGVQNVQCLYCLSVFEDGDQLLRHIKSHSTDDKCAVCGVILEDKLYDRECHLLTHGAAFPYSCLYCKFRFFFPNELKQHLISHEVDENYCEMCDKGFLNHLEFLRHLLTHVKETYNSCVKCSQIFKRSYKIYDKVSEIAVEPLFNCNKCLISFNHFTHRRQHNLQHVVKKHQCESCNVSFNRLNNLKKHSKKMHPIEFKDGEEHVSDSEDEETTEFYFMTEFEEPFTKINMAV